MFINSFGGLFVSGNGTNGEKGGQADKGPKPGVATCCYDAGKYGTGQFDPGGFYDDYKGISIVTVTYYWYN